MPDDRKQKLKRKGKKQCNLVVDSEVICFTTLQKNVTNIGKKGHIHNFRHYF